MSVAPPLPLGISPAVPDWLAKHVPGLRPPIGFTRLPGGRSNLTYLVTDAAGVHRVLRRPPLGSHAATAHDVLREARLLDGLTGEVPVPAILAVCADDSVTDAPFVVMEHLDGLVLRDPAGVEASLSVAQRRLVGPALIDAMVTLHRVDPARVGLGALTARRDHVARQLRRWYGNWRRGGTRELPDLEAAHARLAELVPEQRRTGIVHGDYRLDNCILDPSMAVRGILDWELTTVGDPLVDLGQFLVYWAEPADRQTALYAPPTVVPGFSTRAELAERYCAATGDDPAALDYHLAFSWWKTACIVEDVYARMRRGAMGVTDRSPESFAEQAAALAAQARRAAARLVAPR
ncbi:phosphotransferase family protein [Micromonospora sp. DR5-3]|uniref:phosphotransferase family protein n=1 Tax=unclassified Micromonospora TaxID=2617518 RepID=UPI0011DB3903|nr:MULTISPECIES: phosphotransferase family protein [unclassified Micromonospora]MCW3819064.1 phosphotransferase family protein [Micromonospora sp. DR5-3]TYC14079.1 phosphotransferase family protein [Micromonospora sp. MP36]